MQGNFLKINNLGKVYDSNIGITFGYILNTLLRKKIGNEFYKNKSFALKEINFNLYPNQVLGILGRNGSGKSTLLKLISGLLSPTTGSIKSNFKISSILELGIGFNLEMTGKENSYRFCLYNNLDQKNAVSKLSFIEDFADIGDFFHKPIKYYSSGMFARIAFACAISLEADLLIIDEILSVGDIGFQNKCFNFLNKEFLKNQNRSVIYVGHNTEISKKICTHGLLLDQGRSLYFGHINNAIDQYKQLLSTLDSEKKEKNDVKTLKNNFNKEAFQSEYIDLFSSRFINKDFNRIGGQVYGEITSIKVKGTPKDGIFNGNEALEFIITVAAKKEFDPALGYAIMSVDGTQISGTNSHLSNLILKKLKSGFIQKYSIKTQINLNKGFYFFDFGLDIRSENSLKHDDILSSLMIINVENAADVVGVTKFENSIKEI